MSSDLPGCPTYLSYIDFNKDNHPSWLMQSLLSALCDNIVSCGFEARTPVLPGYDMLSSP